MPENKDTKAKKPGAGSGKPTNTRKPISRKKKRKKKNSSAAVIVLVIALVLYIGLSALDFFGVGINIDLGGVNIFELFGLNKAAVSDPLPVPQGGEVIYHFIDVGQGDAVLISTPDGNILVDTSEKSAKDSLKDYLGAAGVSELKYLVLTHPDADHIGNAQFVIENYKVENVVMTDYASTSKTYENLLDAIEEKKVNVIIPENGYSFKLGALTNTVIAPVKEYDDPNEMSLVIKSVYGDTSVMLTGDAEVESEEDILKKWSVSALQSDILKVGHHGSSTSTTEAFLKAVNPRVAIISCGEGNSYGHPHAETLERLENKGVKIYRTDEKGSIIYKTDGNDIILLETRK